MTTPGARLGRRAPGAAVRDDTRPGHDAGARLRLSLALTAVLGGLGCRDRGPTPGIVALSPSSAYSDVPVTLLVDTVALRPALVVDVAAETARYDDGSIHMALVGEQPGLPASVPLGPVQPADQPMKPATSAQERRYLTTIPAGLPPGTYGLRVMPPNDQAVTALAEFQELGPDTIPPAVTVDTPLANATLGAGPQGSTVTATIEADDGVGILASVSWATSGGSSGVCSLPPQPYTNTPPSRITCPAPFTVAPLALGVAQPAPFWLRVVATDVAGQSAALEVPLQLANLPDVESFESAYGALAGNQPIAVHGSFFLPDAAVSIDGFDIIGRPPANKPGGDRLDDGTIVGFTPHHARPGDFTVQVRDAAGVGSAPSPFRYVAPPNPRAIQPEEGPATGGIRVTVSGNDLLEGVVISFGVTAADSIPMVALNYQANDKVVGCLPPGEGTVSVWATDPITGQGALMGSFTYTDEVDAAALVDSACVGVVTP